MDMEKDLTGKVAIVTGGASGIGQATAILYAEHGAQVVVSDIHEQAGNDMVAQIKQKGGEAIYVQADVSRPEDCQHLVSKAVEAFGRIDIAFNNAGIVGEVKDQLVKLHPMGRFGESNEVAELVVWLSSDKASFVTGSYYPVDGGYLAQ